VCAKALVRVAAANAGVEICERTFDGLDNASQAIANELRRRHFHAVRLAPYARS
jgi:hypothetical protein